LRPRKLRRATRRKLQMIFQDPLRLAQIRGSPLRRSSEEALDIHGLAENASARRKRIAELLAAVGLDPAHTRSVIPHEFKRPAQRQRIGIRRARWRSSRN